MEQLLTYKFVLHRLSECFLNEAVQSQPQKEDVRRRSEVSSLLHCSIRLGGDESPTVACSMASAGFAACMGASPETVLQAAEIGIGQLFAIVIGPSQRNTDHAIRILF